MCLRKKYTNISLFILYIVSDLAKGTNLRLTGVISSLRLTRQRKKKTRNGLEICRFKTLIIEIKKGQHCKYTNIIRLFEIMLIIGKRYFFLHFK